jgi:hypothetical protein
MMEELRSSGLSVLRRAAGGNIPEDGILLESRTGGQLRLYHFFEWKIYDEKSNSIVRYIFRNVSLKECRGNRQKPVIFIDTTFGQMIHPLTRTHTTLCTNGMRPSTVLSIRAAAECACVNVCSRLSASPPGPSESQ